MSEYRVGQAAELLGVSADTSRRWTDSGRIKATVVPGKRRTFDGMELARFAIEMAAQTSVRTNPVLSRRAIASWALSPRR